VVHNRDPLQANSNSEYETRGIKQEVRRDTNTKAATTTTTTTTEHTSRKLRRSLLACSNIP
jgi:hypothetical protein